MQVETLTVRLFQDRRKSLTRKVIIVILILSNSPSLYIFVGTVLNLNKGRSGRKPSALTANKLQMMQDLIEGIYLIKKYYLKDIYLFILAETDLPARVSRSSCRKHRLLVPMTKSSFNRGIKKLGFHPYKLIYKYKIILNFQK